MNNRDNRDNRDMHRYELTHFLSALRLAVFWAVLAFCAFLVSGKALAASGEKGPDIKPGLLTCQPGHSLAPDGADAALARGFNLPNWSPDYQGYKPDDALLGYLRKAGFSHIRLPIDGERLMRPYTDDKARLAYLDALDRAVTRLHALGFAVSIDMHPGGAFQATHTARPERGYELLKDAWGRIVHRADGWPSSGPPIYFELLNEPTPPQEIWWPQAQRLIDAIRAMAPQRPIIVGPAVYQRHEPLRASPPLKGAHLIYAIHYYDPFLFTHQAMTWDEGSVLARLGRLPFPASLQDPELQQRLAHYLAKGDGEAVSAIREGYDVPWTAERIAADMAAVAHWADSHHVPVIVNEFGTLTFDVEPEARHRWLTAVRKGAEASCIGWAHWDFSDGFAMIDERTSLPDPFVLDALLNQSP